MAGRTAVELKPHATYAAVIRRGELFLWLAICLFANQSLQLIDTKSLKSFTESLTSQNYLFWLAVYVVIIRLRRVDPEISASRCDCWAALVMCSALLTAAILPYRFGTGLLATGMAAYALLLYDGDPNLKAAGGVLLAVSAQLVWSPILFQLFTPELLRADAALVGEILAWLRPDIVWRGTTFTNSEGHSIVLIGACSSFNNVSSALLACVAVTMLMRTEWQRSDLATIGIACVVMILANSLRICLLAWSAGLHRFWHNGIGEQLLAISQTLIILLIAWQGASRKSST